MTDDGVHSLLWYAAMNHPDAAVRTGLGTHLHAGIQARLGDDIRASLTAALRRERGTVIEPFELTDDDVIQACEVAELALHNRDGALQVVSRDKVSPAGGLLLHLSPNSGAIQSHYLECIASRRGQAKPPAGVWRYSPGHRPDPLDLAADFAAVGATVSGDDRGFRIKIGPFPITWGLRVAPVVDSPRHAGQLESPERLGLSTSAAGSSGTSWLSLKPGTPEGVIRLTAAMVGSEWLLVRLAGDSMPLAAVVLRLDLPGEGGSGSLRVVPVLGDPVLTRVTTWLSTGNRTIDAPGGELGRAIGDWLGIAPAWATTTFLEGYA